MKPFCCFLTLLILVLPQFIHSQEPESHYLLYKKQAQENIFLLENQNNIIPIKRFDTLSIAAVSIGSATTTAFQNMLGNYTEVDFFNIPVQCSDSILKSLLQKLNTYNLVIAGVHSNVPTVDHILQSIQPMKIEVSFVDSAGFIQLQDIHPEGLVACFGNNELNQELAAQLIFGGIQAKGTLKTDLGKYPAGSGIFTGAPVRLSYSIPEDAGVNSFILSFGIDSIVNDAIVKQAFPGCNILVAKDGKVIFHQTYGYHTYEIIIPTSKHDIYDLASITKVSSATPAYMKLYEEGKFSLDDRFSKYWTDWDKRLFHRSNKEDITFRELLAHQAGLIPFIRFYEVTQKNGKMLPKWYRVEEDKDYASMVTPGLFLKTDFKKKVYKTIRLTDLKDRGKYVYSDLFFILSPEVISKISGRDYLQYLDSCFYKPLGAVTMTYLPTEKFSIERIVPTEDDHIFRKRLLQGSVHDEASAVLGGISGNAGLFSTANDLAKLLQMYLQNGTYGGEQYLKEETVREFTRVQYPENKNRRGLGFDKPLLNNSTLTLKDSYPSPDASPESFGHSGYTGTFFWVDPKYNLVYIMMANRVYPTRNNNKLIELSIRTKLQQVIYDAMLRGGE